MRLGAIALRTDPTLALSGRRCVPARLQAADFVFAYPELPAALEELVAS